MKQINLKKLVLLNLPYLFVALFATKLAFAGYEAEHPEREQKYLTAVVNVECKSEL